MARAVRVTLFEREVREKLSVAAIEILLERARILSEGKRSASPTAAARYFGSTMITVDVSAIGDAVREPCDARATARVAALIRDDVARHAARAEDRRARGRAARRRRRCACAPARCACARKARSSTSTSTSRSRP